MVRSAKDWELYERLIARMIANQIETEFCVTPNARIIGKISGRSRQIDVLIDLRHDTDNSRRIIVDAKNRKKKVDVKDVESFRGLMEDVNATHGYLISPAGYTKAAERRAQTSVSIRIVPLDHMEDFDPSAWPPCENARCKGGGIFWDGYPELSIELQPVGNSDVRMRQVVPFLHYVGKCDRCRRFHGRCMTCKDILSIPEDRNDDFGHQCRCRLPWFWLASIEQDDEGNRSAELHVILGIGNVITVNRRSL
jgi:hypothetical protein